MATPVEQYDIAKSIAIKNGVALIFNEHGEIANNPVSILSDDKIFIPRRNIDLSRVAGILINSGSIRFEDNKALLNFILQHSQNRTVMSQLGKVAEAIIVKRCAESEEVNYRLFCIATGKRARKETARQFEACGTSLIDTRSYHSRHYNPQDTQRDIIFINSLDKVAFMSNATPIAGECAGLQIKTSNDIINYVIHDIINGRYCVPVICFPLMAFPNTILTTWNSEEEIYKVNIYDTLMEKIRSKKRYSEKLIQVHQDYFSGYLSTKHSFESRLYDLLTSTIFDINDIDEAAFSELLYVKDILELLVQRRIYPDDLLRESDTLKSALLSRGLNYVSPSVQTNNILIA